MTRNRKARLRINVSVLMVISEQNQGVITVTLIDSPTHATIDDMELRRKLTTFGDVKSITLNNGRHE